MGSARQRIRETAPGKPSWGLGRGGGGGLGAGRAGMCDVRTPREWTGCDEM